MNRIESLTIRTTKALGRLTSLQRRAQAAPAAPGIIRDALEELTATLDELRAANENLVEQATQMASARHSYEELRRDYLALFSAMPVACVFTDGLGTIADANPDAAKLLNVGRQHLVGKPLLLFFMNRDRLIQTLTGPTRENFEQLVIVRPRERKPREVLLRGTPLPDGQRWCWFLEQPRGPEVGPE